jgi:paraquat-inducible protein B
MLKGLRGKTTIKSRSVDVGVVESATLTDDLTHVEIKARLNAGMEKLLHRIRFSGWLNRRSGVKGSAVWGRCCPAPILNCSRDKGNQPAQYQLLDSPPLAPPDAKGIRVILDSKKAGSSRRAIRCCSAAIASVRLRTSTFDAQKRYQLSAVHQCAKRSSGHQQRSLLERQRYRGGSDLGGHAR